MERSRLSLSSKQDAVLFGGAVVLALIASNALHGYVHEVLGHGLFSLIMGGFFDGFYVSPFSVSYSIAYVFSDHGLDAVRAFAGTAVSSAAGFAIIYLVYPLLEKRRKNNNSFQWSFASLIAAATFQADWVYAFFSLVGHFGDMDTVVTKLQVGNNAFAFALAIILVILVVYYPIFSRFLKLLVPYYHRQYGLAAQSKEEKKTGLFVSNFKMLFFSIGIPVLVYAAILEAYSLIFHVLFSTPLELAPGVVTVGILTVFLPMGILAWRKRKQEGNIDYSAASGEPNGEIKKSFDLRAMAIVSVAIIVVNFAVMGPVYYMAWGIFWDEHPWYYNINVKMDSTSSATVTVKALPGWANNDLWLAKATAENPKYDHYIESAVDASGKMFALDGKPSVKVLQTYTVENEKGYFVQTGNVYALPLRVVELKVSDIQPITAADGKIIINSQGFDSLKSGDSSPSSQNAGYSQLQLLSITAAPGNIILDYGPDDGTNFKRSACVVGELCNNDPSYVLGSIIDNDGSSSVYWLRQHDNYEVSFGKQ